MLKSDKHFIQVSDDQQLETEIFGNPAGFPIVFLHGGPGAYYNEIDKSFFNPEKHFVLFFNQRACGSSKHQGILNNNTTQDLVADILFLINYFKLDKPCIFGGSWGATLALLFGIAHPDKISRLLLRGSFIANKASRVYFQEGGIRKEEADIWNRFCSFVPRENHAEPYAYYIDQILHGPESLATTLAFEYQVYGFRLSKANQDTHVIEKKLRSVNYYEKAKIQCHYEWNDFFIPDNFILDNCQVLQDLPVSIVHGEDDRICTLEFAQLLHQHLEHSKIFVEKGGHSGHDPYMKRRLISELNKFC